MKQVKCFVDENAPIALMELTKIEVRPSMTLEDIRESHPKTYNDIVDRIEHFKEHTCTTRKENDYNDSYKKWLEQKLDEYTGVMNAASTLHAYMLANEQRRVCIEELTKMDEKTPEFSTNASGGDKSTTGGEKTQQRAKKKQPTAAQMRSRLG